MEGKVSCATSGPAARPGSRIAVSNRALIAVALSALFAAPAGAQVVRVVGPPGPGVDFTHVQAAIDASADGDIVVLLPGASVESVTILNKSLVLHGVPDAAGVRPGVADMHVFGMAPIRYVLVRGVRSAIEGPQLAKPTLQVEACLGPVLFEDCLFDETSTDFGQPASVKHCAKVAFTRCMLRGAESKQCFPACTGRPALRVEDAFVALSDCHLFGGDGLPATPDGLAQAGLGGPCLELVSGTVLAQGGALVGGNGGDGAPLVFPPGGCVAAGDGGPGVLLGGLLRRMDVTIAGGAPGDPLGCAAGAPGSAILEAGGSVVSIAESLAIFAATSPAEPGGTCTLELHGPAGAPALLLLSATLDVHDLPGLDGVLVPAAPPFVVALGTVPASGSLTLVHQVPASALGGGAEGLLILLQSLVPAAAGGAVLSSPTSTLVTLDVP